ncbi:transcriptional repressor CTCF [Trichonephila clavipes]|nr:transcriptional repressor CTCF [Trichonephila clavipes]
MDHFSKWAEIIPLKKASARVIADNIFDNYISRFGAPIKLISDNGPQLISDVFENLSEGLGIRHVKTVVYRPQANRTERINRDLVQMIANYVNEQHETNSYVSLLMLFVRQKSDETEIETCSSLSDNGSLRDESSGFDRVQRRSQMSRKMVKRKGQRVTKRALSSNESVLQKYRRKRSKQDTVAVTRYNLRPRDGREVESRPAIERMTQQGGPGRSRKGRERNDNPYIEERTRSSNKNARRGGDQQPAGPGKERNVYEKVTILRSPGGKRQLQVIRTSPISVSDFRRSVSIVGASGVTSKYNRDSDTVLSFVKILGMDENASETEGGETITDIQNYLASFNKEIQDGGTAGTSGSSGALEATAEGAAAEQSTETAFFVAAPGSTTGEGFQFEQTEAPFGTTYYTSSDGTYYAATTGDPNQPSTLTFATQADGTTVLPVSGQRTAYRTVSAGDHTGLQQIVLAVSEAGSATGTSGGRQEIVAIPASLTPQAISNAAQVGEQQTFVAMQATASHDGQIDEGQNVQTSVSYLLENFIVIK